MKRITTLATLVVLSSSCSPPTQSCQYSFDAGGQSSFSCAESSGLTPDQTQAYRTRCEGSNTDGGVTLASALGAQATWKAEPCPRARAAGACTIAASGGFKEAVWYYDLDAGAAAMTEQLCGLLSGTWEKPSTAQ